MWEGERKTIAELAERDEEEPGGRERNWEKEEEPRGTEWSWDVNLNLFGGVLEIENSGPTHSTVPTVLGKLPTKAKYEKRLKMRAIRLNCM